MPKPVPDLEVLKNLREKGFDRFVAKISWDPGFDFVAKERFDILFDVNRIPDGIDKDWLQGYSLTGERTMLLIGFAKSAVALQELCAAVTFGSGIRVKFYPAVEIHELRKIMEKFEPEKAC